MTKFERQEVVIGNRWAILRDSCAGLIRVQPYATETVSLPYVKSEVRAGSKQTVVELFSVYICQKRYSSVDQFL